ncbi:hypothetical protein [Hydrogenophaga crassostreae]|nr:hypothetical protein [Hydrogenophaga crassostreae]
MNDSTTTSSSAAKSDAKNDKSAQKELYRLNPAPKEGYEVTLTIENAPGPFKQVSWSAMYQAKGCSYVVNDFAGVRGEPEKVIELPFKKQADGSYVATVYLDAMLDEDYYGNGVCKWALSGVGAGGTPTGASDETAFNAHIDLQHLSFGEPQSMYYRKELYGTKVVEDANEISKSSRAAFGWEDPSKFGAALQGQVFSMKLVPRKINP